MYRFCQRLLTGLAIWGTGLAAAPGAELLATFSFGVNELAYDTARDRVYASVQNTNELAVIDAKTLALVAKFYIGSDPRGLAISTDGATLYVANAGSTIGGIVGVDLDTLSVVKSINTSGAVTSLFCGTNQRIFALTANGIKVYDATTGTLTGNLSVSTYSGILRGTPDRNLLFYANFGLSGSTFTRIDISTLTPQTLQSASGGSNGQDLAISHDGLYAIYPNGAPYEMRVYSTDNITQYYGTFLTGAYPRKAEFSWYDDYAFTVNSDTEIKIYRRATFSPAGQIGTNFTVTDLLTEPSDSLLFVGSSSALRVYDSTLVPFSVKITAGEVDFSMQTLSVSFSSMRGRKYRVQGGTTPSGPWVNLGATIVGNGETMQVECPIPPGLTRYYFRVIKST